MDTQALIDKAQNLGFSMIGWIPAAPARRLDAYFSWIDQNMHGEMGYLARPDRQIRRQDPNVILNDVQTIICVGLDYFSRPIPPYVANDSSRGRISNYAWGADYHDIMTPKLEELAVWLKEQAQTTEEPYFAHRVYVDTGAILERDHAETAGFGFTGKNTMLIHPRRGSWFFLGEILTTAILPELPSDEEKKQIPNCGSCTRCLSACPTNAFPQPYVLDARRCISYLTIELKGSIPRDLRPLIGNWIYGCDVCQDVCPFNRFKQLSQTAEFFPPSDDWNQIAPPLAELLKFTADAFNAKFKNSPIKRIKYHRFMRNVCVAAGNSGNKTHVAQLEQLLMTAESPLVREHAVWAFSQLLKKEAQSTLKKALEQEEDEQVKAEINLCLSN